MIDPSVTVYGELNPDAPDELKLFSFLVGKWAGTGKTKLEEDAYAEYELTWKGRYILNGMVIADEIHSLDQHDNPFLGISLRSYDVVNDTWVVEYLNVSGSFLRKQVSPNHGKVMQNENGVTVLSNTDNTIIRENYRLLDHNHFTYRLDMSEDQGASWKEAVVEMKLERQE